jgi:hypothetical protein
VAGGSPTLRLHRQTKARPLDQHFEICPPDTAAGTSFDAAEVVYRTVDAEGFVVYRNN